MEETLSFFIQSSHFIKFLFSLFSIHFVKKLITLQLNQQHIIKYKYIHVKCYPP